ncbi:MAG TPA: phosphatase PAP2 family protein [Vicinamibacterales bacterium]|nr:phosphatase PAP2 family protein [Vicinamibacterales bacterium]
MFDVDPVIWLQSWASPALTAAMNGISTLGYTRAYVAIAALLAFGFRLRAAVPVLVLLALNGAFTDIAKTSASLERPDADTRVQSLSLWASELRHRDADTPTEVEDSYGFPSGHVSTTTTFAVGLAMLLGWRRRGWAMAIVWIAAMGVSRMYLGRHFLGDVIGGVLVGLGTIAVAFAVLKIAHLVRESRKHHPWPAHRIMAVAIVFAAGALLVGLPDAGDAGRLLGTAIGALYLVRHDLFERQVTVTARAVLVISAAAGFAGAWAVMSAALEQASPDSVSALRLAASALPNAALLIVPALVPARLYAAREQQA